MECRNKRWLSGCAAFLLLIPGAIVAQTPTQVPKSPPKTEVDRLVFKGVKHVDLNELRLSLYTEQSHCTSWILTPLCMLTHAHYVFARRYLNHDELKRDVLRGEVFYWKRGYRETVFDTTVVPRGSDGAVVTFLVNEGLPTLVSDITITQKNPILTDREIKPRVVLSKGTPLNLLRLDSSRVFLQQSLWDKGYADAVVDTTLVLDSATHSAAINIDLDPKWKATVSDIIVEGNDKIQTRTILKSLTLKPGSLFRRSELLRSQRALYESNLFKRASIDIPKQGDSSKVLIVNVTESPLHEARVSFGFNTIDFFQLEGRFTQYNFLGRARRLDVDAAMGNLFASGLNGRFIFRDAFSGVINKSSAYLLPTYNASVNFTEPWYGAPQNSLGLSFFSHRRSAPGIFIDKGFGTSATFTREVMERAPVSINYRFELNRVDAGDVYFCINYGVCDQPTLGALRNRHNLSPLTLTGNIDRANDPYSPTQGYRAEADIEHASALTASDFRYNRATTDAAVYHKVRSRGSLAGHLRLGWVGALESTKSAIGISSEGEILHPRKRFYAGGSRSVRGFGENQLGPRVLTIPAARLRRKDPGCTPDVDITTCNPNAPDIARTDFEPRPLGGNFVAESSIEYRFPLWRQLLVGAVFADGGYVSQKTSPDLPKSRAEVTPGFGVRYRSPVGPIRIDFGINPGRQEELPVVTEQTINGRTTLVKLDQKKKFGVAGSGATGFLDRLVLHLSIGEAF